MQQRTIRALSIALFLGLLVWGLFATLVYLGVPVHGTVFLSEATLQSLQGVCDPGALLCRGVYTLVPMLLRTVGRASIFLPYTILSIIVFGAIVARAAMRDGNIRFRCTLSPLWILVFFLSAVWALFTTFSYSSVGDAPMRRIIEPLPQVYQNVGEEGLAELRKNFQRLEDGGCLTREGALNNGASVFSITTLCMQKFFVLRVLTQLLWALFILFELLVLGHAVLRLFRLRMSPLSEAVLSAGLGAGLWIAMLWFLAVLGIFLSGAIWTLLILVPAVGYRSTWHWLRELVHRRWTVDATLWNPVILISWLLLSYFAVNFISVIRPFPIGWDDLGSYLNRPNLLVSYGHFIHSMAPFQWEYLTAVGFSVFGFGSPVGATAAMVINWTQGVLAVLTIIAFGRAYFGQGGGLLSGLLYYSLPLVGHFSYADMKIDNAVFAMGAMATFSLFLGILPPVQEGVDEAARTRRETLRWLALAGVFVGFAFGMKVTAIMVMLALLLILAGVELHWIAAPGAAAVGIAALAFKGGLDVTTIAHRIFGESASVGSTSVLVACAVVALGFAAAGFVLGRDRWKTVLVSALCFIGGFFAAIAPWIEHNTIQSGSIIPTSFRLGAPDKVSLRLDIKDLGLESQFNEPVRVLPAELKLDPTHPACGATGHSEELDRYWGFRKGWGHYLSLPWRAVLNLDSAGYYVTTMPALLLFPLLLLLPYFWSPRGRWLRWLSIGTFFILLEWIFTANGILWYGIGMFFGFMIALEALVTRAPDKLSRTLSGILITVALFSNFAHRFWQFENQRNLFEYPMGRASAEVMRERTIPHYDDIAEIALQIYQARPDRPYIYRVGTFIPYFIPKNLEVIGIVDHQLDVFNCLYQERDSELTANRLRALGFSSIIFDTNTATIERDSNGSLHQKVQAFVDFLNDPKSELQVIVNDPDGGVAYLLIP